MARFKVYDTVWTYAGSDPTPKSYVVYAVIEEMALMKAGKIDLSYRIVPHQVGATLENSICRTEDELFACKAEMVAAYVKSYA